MMEENNNGIAHNKKEFQIERIAFFSDAVFAIAITLLIIEIKIPDIHGEVITDEILLHKLIDTIPPLIGFFVSFFVISLYWLSHHRMFRYVHHYSPKLVWVNLIFLLSIIIMPFSTALYSEYFRPSLHVPIIVYALNISFTGLYSFRLWRIIGNPKYNPDAGLHPVIIRYNSLRALIVPALFIIVALLSFVSKWVAFLIPPFLPFVSMLIKRHYYKKYPKLMQAHL